MTPAQKAELLEQARAHYRLTATHGDYNGVKWCSSSYGDGTARHVVFVLAEGKYYECDDRDFALLRSGISPDDLGIDPLTDADIDALDNSTYWEGW